MGPLPKTKTSFFCPLYFRGTPLEPRLGPLKPRMGPLKLNPRPHLLFRHLRPHLGVPPPPARLPPNLNRALQKDRRKDCDVLNLTIPDFTTSDHILTFPGTVKQNNVALGEYITYIFANTFELRKIEKKHETPSYSSRQDASKHMHLDHGCNFSVRWGCSYNPNV